MKPALFFSLVLFLTFIGCQKQQSVTSFQIPDGQLHAFFKYQEDRIPLVSAHRGGRNILNYPENAIETFEYVASQTPCIIEFDVSMTQDSVLVLMHDNTLDRTTTGNGKVTESTWKEIQKLKLIDDFGNVTTFKVPLYTDALKWAKNRTVVTVDVKRGVPFSMVLDEIEKQQMEEYAVIITYSVSDALQVHQLNKDVVMSVSMRNPEEVQRMVDSGIPTNRMLAFTGTTDSGPELYEQIHGLGISCILGVLGNIDKRAESRGPRVYRELIQSGVDILATDRPIEASKAIQSLIPVNSSKAKYFITSSSDLSD